MSFMNEGQAQSGQLEGISLRNVMSNYEDNPLRNKGISKLSKIQVSTSLMSEGQV